MLDYGLEKPLFVTGVITTKLMKFTLWIYLVFNISPASTPIIIPNYKFFVFRRWNHCNKHYLYLCFNKIMVGDSNGLFAKETEELQVLDGYLFHTNEIIAKSNSRRVYKSNRTSPDNEAQI